MTAEEKAPRDQVPGPETMAGWRFVALPGTHDFNCEWSEKEVGGVDYFPFSGSLLFLFFFRFRFFSSSSRLPFLSVSLGLLFSSRGPFLSLFVSCIAFVLFIIYYLHFMINKNKYKVNKYNDGNAFKEGQKIYINKKILN